MSTQKNPLLYTCLSLGLLVFLAGCAAEQAITPSRFYVPFSGSPPESGAKGSYPPPAETAVAASPSSAPSLTAAKTATKTTTPLPARSATPGDAPAATLVWPTPKMDPTSTPYVRPADAKGQTLPASRWQEWPVIPVVSDRARAIYKAGLKAGNDPKRLAKVGDCQVIRQYFLGIFDDPVAFKLGSKYAYLQRTIDQFAGSWTRVSESVRTGFNVASVLTPLYANPKNCNGGETPLQCEFRLWKPSIVIISMETWTPGRPTAAYEGYLRQILDFVISQNAVPILATKADNKEGDNSINAAIVRVAADYDIPLWNFWRAAQPLTDHGLREDGFHLTNDANHYDSAANLDKGWPVRNLTALQSVDTVWQAVKK